MMPSFANDPTEAVFDWNVFEWGFDVMDIPPAFKSIAIEPEFGIVEAGQAVAVVATIVDLTTTLGETIPFDPATLPEIEILNPDDTVKVAFTDMNFVETGKYQYQHQTLSTDQTGAYSVRLRAVDGTMTGLTTKTVAFVVK